MSIIDSVLDALKEAREQSPAALVAYSDGKDSRVIMDMALRVFDRVEGFYLYVIPGLKIMDQAIADASVRWGVPIRQYPHPLMYRLINTGTYCHFKDYGIPEWKLADVYALAMKEAGIEEVVLTGQKMADSSFRKRLMMFEKKRHMRLGTKAKIIHPISEWRKTQVVGYLRMRGIPEPDSSGHTSTGIDLSNKTLYWLYDSHREDFERVAQFFPFIWAVIKRREFYGDRSSAAA